MYLSSILQAALRVLVLSVMARLLDPHDFGLMGIALIFTSCAERIGQIGVGLALIQKEDLSDQDARAGMLLSIISGVLIALFLVVISPCQFPRFLNTPYSNGSRGCSPARSGAGGGRGGRLVTCGKVLRAVRSFCCASNHRSLN
jgi:hypothetical protein